MLLQWTQTKGIYIIITNGLKIFMQLPIEQVKGDCTQIVHLKDS